MQESHLYWNLILVAILITLQLVCFGPKTVSMLLHEANSIISSKTSWRQSSYSLWNTSRNSYGSLSIYFAISSWHVKLRIIYNWARYMIPYFNPHYLFRGWEIIADIISDWFTIFGVFLLFKVKSSSIF